MLLHQNNWTHQEKETRRVRGTLNLGLWPFGLCCLQLHSHHQGCISPGKKTLEEEKDTISACLINGSTHKAGVNYYSIQFLHPVDREMQRTGLIAHDVFTHCVSNPAHCFLCNFLQLLLMKICKFWCKCSNTRERRRKIEQVVSFGPVTLSDSRVLLIELWAIAQDGFEQDRGRGGTEAVIPPTDPQASNFLPKSSLLHNKNLSKFSERFRDTERKMNAASHKNLCFDRNQKCCRPACGHFCFHQMLEIFNPKHCLFEREEVNDNSDVAREIKSYM